MNILITGGTGYLAWQLVSEFEKDNNRVTVLTSHPESSSTLYAGKKIKVLENDEVLSGSRRINDIDIVIHTAFCRKSNGRLLYDSLRFLEDFALVCVRDGVKGFINISSQSVYGNDEGPLPDETVKPGPGYLYAFAKLSSELLLRQIVQNNSTEMKFTNIRLASLIGPGKFIPDNVLSKFVVSALKGEQFHVTGGKQNFSFLDVRDAARAIALFTAADPETWDLYYNLGPVKQTNMIEMADEICSTVREMYGLNAGYTFTPDDTFLNAGMNSEKLYAFLNWRPAVSISQTIRDTVEGRYTELYHSI